MADDELTAALARRLYQRAIVQGSIVVPAVPSMLDEYLAMCERMFKSIGVAFTEEQLEQLRDVLKGQLSEAFSASPRSDIVITYDSPSGLRVDYHVKAQWSRVDSAYDAWLATREPPLFGSEADARVMSVALEAPDPRACPILDLGAGTGRNALPLAKRGHPVDAVEVTSGFAQVLRTEIASQNLPVRVMELDILDAADSLKDDYGLIVLSEVASDFRSSEDLRRVFELASEHLRAGGRFVMNIFLPRDAYTPSDAARELGQQCYSAIFTRAEVAAAVAGLPLELESDDSVFDYERAHLPPASWPPTGWFERWTNGQDVFDIDRDASPIELRWLVFRKTPSPRSPRLIRFRN